jgi:hypothetical protein
VDERGNYKGSFSGDRGRAGAGHEGRGGARLDWVLREVRDGVVDEMNRAHDGAAARYRYTLDTHTHN